MLLTMSVYMLLPVMPVWLMEEENFSPQQTGLSMGAFAFGLYLFGVHCSWLVQHYRRNVVCMWAIAAVAAIVGLLWYIDNQRYEFVDFWAILFQRLMLGAAFGLAQMVLSSTLIIDTCESFQRTEANHSASWFSRFALSLGPLTGLLVVQYVDFTAVIWTSVALALVSLLLVKWVTFPFRAPEDNLHVASLDRFFLPQGSFLFVNLLLISMAVGLMISLPLEPRFYALVMAGFLLALLAQRFVFRDAELKSEIISGLILLLGSQLVLLLAPVSPLAPVLVGLSVGIIGGRFLLFFIKLSRHCQRGTSQSTYFLGWETGLVLGVAIGIAYGYGQPQRVLCMAIVLSAVSLLLYHFFTHSWFLRNKNR